MNTLKRAAILCRTNMLNSETAGILQKQLDSCLNHPSLEGRQVPLVFLDIASGLSPIEKMVGLPALLNAIENDLVDLVVCRDLTRISRDSRVSAHVLNTMLKAPGLAGNC